MITLSEDIKEPERLSVAGEQVDMLGPFSIADSKTTTLRTDENQLAKEQVSDDHKMQISRPANTLVSHTCQYLEGDGDIIVHTSEDNCSSENTVTEGVISVTTDASFDREISYGKSDEDYLSSSPAFSAHEEDSTSIEKERRDFNPKKVDTDFSDDTMYPSETSRTGWLSKSVSSVSEDQVSDESGSSSCPPMPVSTHEVDRDNLLLMDSQLPPTCDADDSASEEGWVSCESGNKKDNNALQTNMSETLVGSSGNEHEEYYRDDHSKIVISPSETDTNALQNNRPESSICSSERGHEEYYKDGHSNIVISPSETGPIFDHDFESVDLSPNPKPNTRSVVLSSNDVRAGSCRKKGFKYYKNLIKGAFSSEKRVSKEYEHLALMYHDSDVNPNQLFEPSSLSSVPNTAPPVAGAQSAQEMKDQWELV